MMKRLGTILVLLQLVELLLPAEISFMACAFSSTLTASRRRSRLVLRQSASNSDHTPQFQHALAILSMPYTSCDRIANEAILEQVLPTTNKLSVVLRCEGPAPSLASLRRYVGEVYSQLWDCAVGEQENANLMDVVVYPQNLPNVAPESWIGIQPDLEAVCSHDSIIGWFSEDATGRGRAFQEASGQGQGGLDEHVAALNSERASRNLRPVQAVHMDHWPAGATPDPHVLFLDDDPVPIVEEPDNDLFLGGARIPQQQLFESVAVGGTFDGLHYGHRKLLTLAMSSVCPVTGQLLVGVTVDEMLTKKTFAEYIPPLQERMDGVREFLGRLAPGMRNRIKIKPISDAFGPPGQPDMHFDALVLSHETLETGFLLNRHRVEAHGLKPLVLLCTRRTEPHGMSSTALRRLRSQQAQTRRVGT